GDLDRLALRKPRVLCERAARQRPRASGPAGPQQIGFLVQQRVRFVGQGARSLERIDRRKTSAGPALGGVAGRGRRVLASGQRKEQRDQLLHRGLTLISPPVQQVICAMKQPCPRTLPWPAPAWRSPDRCAKAWRSAAISR